MPETNDAKLSLDDCYKKLFSVASGIVDLRQKLEEITRTLSDVLLELQELGKDGDDWG